MHLNRLVLGTVGLGGVWGSIDPEESVQTILCALQNGVGAIDTAPAYGDAEMYVGKALSQWQGPKPRLSTKVGRLKGFSATEGRYDYSADGMMRSVELSLATLGVPAVDILFLHDPAHMNVSEAGRVVETLLAIKEQGYAAKIGLGGNPPEWFRPYIEAGVFEVLMEFNKLNACNTRALVEYLPFCEQRQIEYYAASPLFMGLLGNRFDDFTTDPPVWISHETVEIATWVNSMAVANNMSLHELAHRFLLSLPFSFQIVIGASNLNQLQQTLADFNNGPLEPGLVEKIMNYADKKMNADVQNR